jgi:hypothetical protein
MKKNVIVAFAGTLVIAAFAFSGISFKSSSLQDLKAQGVHVCKSDPSYWCPSETGNEVLAGYIME